MLFNKKKKPKSDSMTKVVEKCVFDRDFFIVGDVYVLKHFGKKFFGICTEVNDDTVHFKIQGSSCCLSISGSSTKSNIVVEHISIKDYD